jgi:hypothetical protein
VTSDCGQNRQNQDQINFRRHVSLARVV